MRVFPTPKNLPARLVGDVPDANVWRYWRFSNITTPGGNPLALGGLQLRDSGDAIISATFSSSMSSGAGNISNLNENSAFSPGVYYGAIQLTPGSTQHITADLGTPKAVAGIRGATWNNTSEQLKTFRLSGSNDNTTYTEVQALVTLPDIATTETLQSTTTAIGATPEPDFGASVRGEIALWDSVAYICTASGDPGTWIELT
jgi:hypothetical protein